MKLPIILAVAFLAVGCCDKDMIRRQAIQPSVESVTEKFDELVVDAVGRGDMDTVEGDVWIGESALLRHIASGSPDPVAVPAPAGAPVSPE